MHFTRLFLFVLAVTAVLVVPVTADDSGAGPSHDTGIQNAISRIDEATTRHVQILTDLLAKVPEQAQTGIQRAIAAAQAEQDKALAALQNHAGSGDDHQAMETDTDTENDGADQGVKPDTTGLARARQAVTAAFAKSVATLQKVIGEAPDQAKTALQTALANIQQSRSTALQNLDRLLAGQKPERASTDRPTHGGRPDRPDRAERPDRPERPERPEAPQRPDRPEIPDHPAPPSHG